MGDVVGLVEQVHKQIDREEMERVATKVKQGREISLEDYRDQLRQIANLGGFEQLLDKIPGVKPEQLAAAKFDPKMFRRQIGIIDSMTPRERRLPGADRRLAQAPDRGRCGAAGPGREPAAQAAQEPREDHETDGQGRRHAALLGRDARRRAAAVSRAALKPRVFEGLRCARGVTPGLSNQ